MVRAVTITPLGGMSARRPHGKFGDATASGGPRMLFASLAIAVAFMAVAGQLVRLAMSGQFQVASSLNATIAESFARPDIVDRHGRLFATDVEAQSLYADPARVIDRDEVVEKLATIFPDLNQAELRKDLADRHRRFVWIRRGLSPKTAQRIHNLGLPGLAFRRELRRAYPSGALAGHVLGHVNIDNKGVAGFEHYLDEVVGVDAVYGATLADRAPARLSLDIGVQHAVEEELTTAINRFRAQGAAGIVLDIDTGEVLASASLPDVDPARPTMSLDPSRIDKVSSSTFELGSVFKMVTVAMALDNDIVSLDTLVDVREPLMAGRFTIRDLHPAGRPLSVADIFIRSSNVGAGVLALEAGPRRWREFLERLRLLEPIKSEIGPIAAPQVPDQWHETEIITTSYGHGIAVAPLQFAAAAATLLNGGHRVTPTFVKRQTDARNDSLPLIKPATSGDIRRIMRRNVIDPRGTGKRANVAGYPVGGKTGTADIPGPGGYKKDKVISSFLAAFPMNRPKYLVFVLLFEPEGTGDSGGEVLAGRNAAPTAGRIIKRIGPLLGLLPTPEAAAAQSSRAFDATRLAKYETR
jgi:cell division protein FtsI (penicillin-binding protein 3)